MLKIGDKVRIKGVEGIHTIEANDSTVFPLKAGGETFTTYGRIFDDDDTVVELVERPAFVFELHDKVAFKGWEAMEHFILHPNDEEDYPFKAVRVNGESKTFKVTREGKANISDDEPCYVLIDRPTKLSVTKVVDGVGVLDVGNYIFHYKSDLLCERVKKAVELTIEIVDGTFWGTCKINDNLIIATGVSEEDLKTNISKVIFDFERIEPLEYRTIWAKTPKGGNATGIHPIPKEDHEPTEAQLETFTRGVELLRKDHLVNTALPVKCQIVEGGKLPTYAHDGDAGMDLYVRDVEVIEGKNLVKYYLGIKLDLDEGYAAFIYPRSSAYKTQHLMTNCVGVVDSGYKGEISAVMACRTPYEIGDRACQMVIMPVPKVRLVQVEELRDSVRGSNGYGSSGK